ncbi:MAG: serine hydrolase [Solobacterium sp.]|nr:serine hydrolase [Solobacterium sp.]
MKSSYRYTVSSAVIPENASWQACVSFPDWCGIVQKSLAMNSLYGFTGCEDQGVLYVEVRREVQSFDLFVNGVRIDPALFEPGETFLLDYHAIARSGRNTLQVTNIEPCGLAEAVTVRIPFPVVQSVSRREPGEAELLLEELIREDIRYGFPSASLVMIRHGKEVIRKAWGVKDTSSSTPSSVTPDTLYDLASVTKMFAVNYPLQKLISDGLVTPDTKVSEILGDAFWQDVQVIPYKAGTGNDPDTQKAWKKRITLRHLLSHCAGFPADARYYYQHYDAAVFRPDPDAVNPLYTGCDGTEETRKRTLQAMFETPLLYEPGTRTLYSDTDYMLLGAVIEKLTGQDLDTCLRETFLIPMGLSRIAFRPLLHGFAKDDCAATELHGNTRDGLHTIPEYRTEVIQGEAHDEKAYYSMAGISGHAGLFATAHDAAVLGMAMLYGGYGTHRFFSRNVRDYFASPAGVDRGDWGMGWFRYGDHERPWHFSASAHPSVIGHQGWTGTLIMIDSVRDTVIAYLTNAKNTPVTDPHADPNLFDGDWYSASGLGLIPELLFFDGGHDALMSLLADMTAESIKRIPSGVSSSHPAVRNAESKLAVLTRYAEKDPQLQKTAQKLKERLLQAY